MTKTRKLDCVGVKSLCKRRREKEKKKRRETAGNASQNNNNNNTHTKKKEVAFPFFKNTLADAHSNTHNSQSSSTVFFFLLSLFPRILIKNKQKKSTREDEKGWMHERTPLKKKKKYAHTHTHTHHKKHLWNMKGWTALPVRQKKEDKKKKGARLQAKKTKNT